MKCQAPSRLDKNGKISKKYAEFMLKPVENRENMTEEQILDWFISRRGGTREELKRKIGEGAFDNWIREKDFFEFSTGVNNPLHEFSKYFKSINDNTNDWTKAKIMDWLDKNHWLGFDNKEKLFEAVYDYYYRFWIENWYSYILTPFKWEEKIICFTGIGVEPDEWEELKRDNLGEIASEIKNKYCIYNIMYDGALLRS